MKPKSHLRLIRQPLALSIALLLPHLPPAHAADGTWITNGSGAWSATANWSGGVVADGVDSTADFSTLDVLSTRFFHLDTARTVGHLVFGDTAPLPNSGIWFLHNNGSPANILTLAVSTGSPTVTVNDLGNSSGQISAIIDGTDGLTKAGASGLTLSGANLYRGPTTIASGFLFLQNSAALGATGLGHGTTVAAGATLFSIVNVTGESLTISGAGVNNQGALLGQGTWAGDVNLAANASIGNSVRVTGDVALGNHELTLALGNNEISGSISGTGSLTKGYAGNYGQGSNGGTTILRGTNTYSGPTTIHLGALHFTKTAALYNGSEGSWTKENITVNSVGELAISVGGVGEFTIAQAKSLLAELTTDINNNGLKAGSHFHIHTGAYPGGAPAITTFDQVIADSTGLGGGSIGLTKSGGAGRTLVLNQANTYTGGTAIYDGVLALSGAGTLGVNSGVFVSAFGYLDLGGTSQTVGAVYTAGRIYNGSLTATSYVVAGGSISANLGGIGANLSVVEPVSAVVTLSGTNTYTGTTTVAERKFLQLAKTASLYNSNASSWTKENITVNLHGGLILSVGGPGEFTSTQAKSLLAELSTDLNNNGLKAYSSYGLDTENAIGDTTFNQVIRDSTGTGGGQLSLIKAGAGRLIFNQANTYSGDTRIQGGTLALSGAGTIGNGHGNLTINNGTLDLGGATQTVGHVTTSYGTFTNGNLIASSYRLGGGYYSAGLGGTGANVTIDSYGDFVQLAGVNNYTGTTLVDGGTLVLRKAAALYNADVSQWTNSNLAVYRGGGVVVSMGGAGEFSVAQAKTLLTNLTTAIDDNGLTAGSSFGIDTQNATGAITFDQVIADSTGNGAGSLRFTVEGEQTLILNRANTYSGPTAIIGGRLQVGHANAIPTGEGKGSLQMQRWDNRDAVLDVNGFDVSLNALVADFGAKVVNDAVGTNKTLTLGSDSPEHSYAQFYGEIGDNSGTGGTLSIEKVGSNVQTLDGFNHYSGTTTVTAGTLIVNGGLYTNSLTTVRSGATLGGSGYMGSLAVEAGGTIAPGNSPGILTTGDFNLAGILSLEVNGTGAGTDYDQVSVNGSVTLGGPLTFSLTGFIPEAGNLFFVIDNDGTDAVSGTFFDLAQGSEFTQDGWLWSLSYDADSLGNTFSGGNDVSLKSLGAVPEPSAGLLVGLGALGLLRRRRRP